MKFLIVISIFLALQTQAFAQQSCPTPEQQIVVVFGNGINTDRNSAKSSLELLKRSLGDTYNGQKLRYDLAYNKTGGMATDLGQSVLQAGIEWDSQIMGWINGVGIAPAWFTTWYQNFLLAVTNVTASEVEEHVEKYRTTILLGQKVLVVSHSQGNFYANEAKKLLKLDVTAEQMESFAIFGVATPANNVGGEAAPYLTNHRDIILTVPGSLPANWTLRRGDGTSADDVPRLSAHYFNDTYVSANFDIKGPLIFGIKAELSKLKDPVPVCENYRKHFIGLLAGSYPGKCNGTVGSASLDANAGASFPNGIVDLSTPDVPVNHISRQLVNTSGFGDNRGIALNAGSVGGSWSLSGEFKQLMRNDGSVPMSCQRTDDTPSSSIAAPVDIAAKAGQLLQGYRGGFPKNRCLLLNKTTNSYSSPATWQPVMANGTVITIGATDYDLAAGRVSEFVAIGAATSYSPADYEPQFVFSAEYPGEGKIHFTYKSVKGLRNFFYENSSSSLSCNLD